VRCHAARQQLCCACSPAAALAAADPCINDVSVRTCLCPRRLPVCMPALTGGPDAAAVAAQCFAIDPQCDTKVPWPCHACHAHVPVTPRPSTHSCGASFFPPPQGSFLGALLPQVEWPHLIRPDRHDIAFMLWWLRWETPPAPVQLCCDPTTQPRFTHPSVWTPCGAAPLRKRAHDTHISFPISF
jgi:hypothetical protein